MLKRYAEVMKIVVAVKEVLSTTAYQYQRFASVIFLIGKNTRISEDFLARGRDSRSKDALGAVNFGRFAVRFIYEIDDM